MSHELRTPLNGILGYAQILKRSDLLKEQEQNGVSIIYKCGYHLLTLINDILDISKIEAQKLELELAPLHLPSLLQSVVAIGQLKADQKGIDFIYQPSIDLPQDVSTDEKRLRQVLLNLIGNAIKFTETGHVTFCIDIEGSTESSAMIHFRIIDTGVGIKEEDLEKLFLAFEQVGDAKKYSEGSGLGLAISQRIVKLMGSSIHVASQPEMGSEFSFKLELPLSDTLPTRSSQKHSQRIIGYQGERRHILVIDDQWDNRVVLKDFLSSVGFIVSEAEEGRSALEVMTAIKPDVVITDLVMPGMDGYELLSRIRTSEDLKETTVIVTSAAFAPKLEQQILDAGGDEFIPKPIEMSGLLDIVSRQLQLNWVYETLGPEDASRDGLLKMPPSLIPPRKDLQKLLDYAESGMIRPLRRHLEALVKRDNGYEAFAKPLLALAQQYDVEQIEVILERSLSSDTMTSE